MFSPIAFCLQCSSFACIAHRFVCLSGFPSEISSGEPTPSSAVKGFAASRCLLLACKLLVVSSKWSHFLFTFLNLTEHAIVSQNSQPNRFDSIAHRTEQQAELRDIMSETAQEHRHRVIKVLRRRVSQFQLLMRNGQTKPFSTRQTCELCDCGYIEPPSRGL